MKRAIDILCSLFYSLRLHVILNFLFSMHKLNVRILEVNMQLCISLDLFYF